MTTSSELLDNGYRTMQDVSNLVERLGVDVPQENFDQVIKRLCFFAPTGSGQYIRNLHDFITQQALSMLPGGQHSARVVYAKVREIFGSRIEYGEIFDSLRRLSESGDIRSKTIRFDDPENQFDINIDKRNELRDAVHREERLERQVLSEWASELKVKYPFLNVQMLEQLKRDVKFCAYKLLSQHSAEALELYYGNDKDLLRIIENVHSLNLIDPHPLFINELEHLRRQEVFCFFLRADEKRRRYIASLMHSIFILYLTRLLYFGLQGCKLGGQQIH